MSSLDEKFLGPFRRLVRQMTMAVDYYALYSAIVNADNGDGTVDMTPEDARLSSMSGIPKAYGLPGVSATLLAGSKVLFCFENGDPARPRVVLYAATALSNASKVSLNATVVNLGDEGGPALGRVGDSVQVTLTAAQVTGLALNVGGTAVTATTPANSVNVTGTITAGSPKARAA